MKYSIVKKQTTQKPKKMCLTWRDIFDFLNNANLFSYLCLNDFLRVKHVCKPTSTYLRRMGDAMVGKSSMCSWLKLCGNVKPRQIHIQLTESFALDTIFWSLKSRRWIVHTKRIDEQLRCDFCYQSYYSVGPFCRHNPMLFSQPGNIDFICFNDLTSFESVRAHWGLWNCRKVKFISRDVHNLIECPMPLSSTYTKKISLVVYNTMKYSYLATAMFRDCDIETEFKTVSVTLFDTKNHQCVFAALKTLRFNMLKIKLRGQSGFLGSYLLDIFSRWDFHTLVLESVLTCQKQLRIIRRCACYKKKKCGIRMIVLRVRRCGGGYDPEFIATYFQNTPNVTLDISRW
jgi:hypothetical protein